jgi:coenzyme F420-reducing hydrogenase delta subunit
MISKPSGAVKPVPQKGVTAFICVNCARPGVAPFSVRPPPVQPAFNWTLPVNEVLVPCAGRLQPELVLKAFETGSSFVCVIACQDDNCHAVEGCLRARRRLDYVRGLLDQIGLGGDRLALFQLPGSAREDMAAGEGTSPASPVSEDALLQQIQVIRDAVAAKAQALCPNPLDKVREIAEEISAVEETDDNED